jgi:hypothetical protein
MGSIVLVILLVLAGLGALAVRRSWSRTLSRIRKTWGQPVERERRLDLIAASHRARRLSVAESAAALDDRTWEDLDLDAVFAALDRTESTLGQHALYHRLRAASVADRLEEFEALVGRFETDRALRERTQVALSRLTDPHGYDLWWLAREDAVDTPRWHVLFPILGAATILLLAGAFLAPQITPFVLGLLVINVVVRYLTDHRMGAPAAAFRQIAPLVTTAESLRFLSSPEIMPLVGAIQHDVPRLGRLKTIGRWISGDPLMLPTHADSVTLLASDIIRTAYEYLNLAFLLDGSGVYFGARDLHAHRHALLRVIEAMGEVDAAISTASFRAGRRDWSRPRFRATGGNAELREVRHPLIDDAVPNSVSLAPGHGGLITGSNMSGKSTFLRTVGVTTVMAQTLNTCLAADYHAPLFVVRTCIGRADDLLNGRSYYVAEVESLLSLIDASVESAPHLFLLDELFRGTNAVERIAAGHAVLVELLVAAHQPKPHVVLAATHDGELVDLSPRNYTPYHFGDSVTTEGLVFDHQLRTGPAATRNAIALLRLHGAPESLIRRATSSAAMLDAQRGTTVESRS